MAYTDQAKIESYLGRDLTDPEQALIDVLIPGVEDYIDTYCARSFEVGRKTASQVDNTIGDKTSDPFLRLDGGEVELFFDQPMQTDTSVTGVIAPRVGYVDQSTGVYTLLDPTSYVFYPNNSTKKTSIMRYYGAFPVGLQNIFVYGTFSDYMTAPDGITTAATIICANTLNQTDDLTSETIEGYARVMDKDWNVLVGRLLDNYRRVVL